MAEDSHRSGYLLAAILGAIGGGVTFALATKALPKMMGEMMEKMKSLMGEGG